MRRSPALFVCLLLAIALVTPGCITLNIGGVGEQAMTETVVSGDRGPKVAMVEIDGLITGSPGRNLIGGETQSTLARVKEQLDLARRDEDVRAVVLRIDTPGGTATASSLIYDEIRRFKETRRVPVVAQLMGTATSGGYYVAMAADRVVACPTTVTGSIGVIFVGVEVSGLMQKLGISNQTVTGGAHKDAGSPLRPMTPAERAQIQSVIDDLHRNFRDVVAAGRPALDRSRVDALADGRIFSAPQAREAGLVDEIASLEDTLADTQRRLGAESIRVVRYHRPDEWRRTVFDSAPAAPVVNVDFGSLLGPLRHPGFHYLWWPGAE